MKSVLINSCLLSVTVTIISELYILYWVVKDIRKFSSSKREVIAMSIFVISLLIYIVTACIILALGWGEEEIHIPFL